MAASSPTALTMDYLHSQGYDLVQKVEVWNPWSRTRHDLFGCWDVLGVINGTTVAIQVTSRGNMSSRIRKIAEAESTPHLRKAGWKLLVHGWDKHEGRHRLKEVDVS